MTSFIHVDQPATHPGIVRAEAAFEQVRAARRGFDGARGLAALLLAAIVSSLLVVADRLVSITQEGGLMVAWLVLWAVAFIGLAFFAGTARSLAVRAIAAGRNVAQRRAAARADERFLAYAKHDPRILNELHVIATHQQVADAEPLVTAKDQSLARIAKRSAEVRTPTLHEAMRRVNLGQYY
ncbi:hypothetical protein QTI33_22805 [Variovorax sp. J22P271]|uniref:hypothetical protein n=1 Tax=Variovorax davisae TaxID=3053515 RepID=UPI002577834F|nr:hypothetical protein [Variovorax sp. J22P271]MDM0034982.1 hypothetical protein [Variovorax sp. J22P271]